MNREIKFRAWNGVDWVNTDQIQCWDLLHDTCYDYQQYTGLKDRNGVEIYEGDIISYHRDKYEIVYSHGCFGLEMEDEDYGGSKLVPLNEIHQMISNEEVIGNIHENRDLLK